MIQGTSPLFFDAWGKHAVYDGQATPLNDTAVGNRYLFQGREYTGRTGLYYFRARWYEPNMARWLSRDPHVESVLQPLSRGLKSLRCVKNPDIYMREQGNLYLLVANNPISMRDALGLACGSGITDKIVPEKPAGFDFISCCEDHDNCYGDCAKKPTKTSCDDAFLQCMYDKCINNYNGQKGCVDLANVYYGFVVRLGQGPFDDARKCCK